ncbi:MAG: putative endo,4-beta-xylanase [Bryobacterales bacterium]|nr:putative endo,4-beta-xylanase [Bryobacterales bacterium]
MKTSAFLLAISIALPLAAAERGEEIKLWPKAAPGSENITATEVSKPSLAAKYAGLPGDISVSHSPSIYVFLPPKATATGAAMVVAPGGGHSHLVMEKEGWEVADWLNAHGIAAFVLKYRLARIPGSTYTLPNEVFADSTRAMRLVRSRAKEFGIDANRLGFIGFSAGGEVAGMIGTKFDAGNPSATDPIERVSSRPDFNILIYPYYRPGSFTRPTTPPPAEAPITIQTNAAFPIPKDAPPVFMVCADDDRSHVEPTVKFYLELEANHIPAEMHIYSYGDHGFGLRPTKKPGAPVESWPDRMREWLDERGFSKK